MVMKQPLTLSPVEATMQLFRRRKLPIHVVVICGFAASLLSPCVTSAQSAREVEGAMTVQAKRFESNPIITMGMDASIGDNINGPSLIRVPDWVKDPLGRYYLYFAHHEGKNIRMAYADDLKGPWRIYSPGTLQMDQTACINHIASPDVHVENAQRQIIMYFHGKTKLGQLSFRAVSKDGINFTASEEPIGPTYFRVFEHDGAHYALARAEGKDEGAVLLRSGDGGVTFERGQSVLPRCRHTAVLKRENKLLVFFSRGYDAPERILLATIDLEGDWRNWKASEPVTVLEPEMDYEGADLPVAKSDFGKVYHRVRELRDPAIFEEDGKTYLLYSIAGESGIAIAETDFAR